MRELDCRGMACPAPVLQTKETLLKDHPHVIKVIVDNEAAKQNVSRFLESQKFDVSVEEKETEFHVIGREDQPGTVPAETLAKEPETEKQKIMVMIATDRMGYGDDELGKKLIINFIKTIKEMGDELWRLVFVNNGVKLTIHDSYVLPELQEYEQHGLLILVCGTASIILTCWIKNKLVKRPICLIL